MLACTIPDTERTIMGAVDDSHHSLVIAAAQAAGRVRLARRRRGAAESTA